MPRRKSDDRQPPEDDGSSEPVLLDDEDPRATEPQGAPEPRQPLSTPDDEIKVVDRRPVVARELLERHPEVIAVHDGDRLRVETVDGSPLEGLRFDVDTGRRFTTPPDIITVTYPDGTSAIVYVQTAG